MKQKTILIFCYSHLNKDPRVLRQITALKDHYKIITAGYSTSGIEYLEFFRIEKNLHKTKYNKILLYTKLFFRRFEKLYWDRYNTGTFGSLTKLDFDCVIANDIDILPVAVRLSKLKGAKLVFDAHEYYPRQFEQRARWRFFFQPYIHYLCKTYLKRADLMTCVCQGIAEEYAKIYKVKPILFTNATQYNDLSPKYNTYSKIKLVHHGVDNKGRKLEKMIELAGMLKHKCELHFYLVKTDPTYYNQLVDLAKPFENIYFHQPVPTSEIPQVINKYDMGIFILPPTNFNYKHALPNKFFEFIQARLGIIIGPSPEMANLLDKYNLGIVTKSFDSQEFAKILFDIDMETVNRFKSNVHKEAFKLSFENNKAMFLRQIKSLLGESQG